MRCKDLTTNERTEIVQFLLLHAKNDKPLRGKMKEACGKWNCSKRTVTRLWAEAKKQKAAGEMIHIQSRKINKVRRKKVEIDLELIQSLDLFKRSTVRKLAMSIQCSKSTVWRWINKGLIISHSSAIKPDLTAPNKLLRLSFSLQALQFDRILNILKFKSMNSTIHIDEKWFFMSKTSHRFYLTPGEAEPHRTCKSKKFIPKVMFMCAVCRPMFDAAGNVMFDGKIGIFPFVEKVPAKRNSKNRKKGTLETKPIQSITKDIIKGCLINQPLISTFKELHLLFLNQIIPAIKAKWPVDSPKLIFIQQDNAKPHINDADPEFRAAATQDGFDIRIVHQPPNSPDTNVNDLGWFRCIQSIQTETSSYTVDQLVDVVINSFHSLSPITLNKVFLSLQSCMVEIMRVKGQNCYKIPHMRKDALQRVDALPIDLTVPQSLVIECINYLIENGRAAGNEGLMDALGLSFTSN